MKIFELWFKSNMIKSTRLSLNRFYSINRNVFRLHERGIFQDYFPDTANQEITDLLNSGPQTVYAGFDPTADSLHLGNLLIIINLLHWQRAGHRVVVVIGGATSQIGDPSGRTTERDQLSDQNASKNSTFIRSSIKQIFQNHETYFWHRLGHNEQLTPLRVVDNADWYRDINAIQFAGNVARHFRMGTMVSKTSVKERMTSAQGMSCAEFLYQIFQAYDWYHLLQKFDCRFQVGGADQMGNIMAGYDLISRLSSKKVYGLTVPLITTQAGEKLGKTAGNAIWLNSHKTSPFGLYQYLIRQRDVDADRLLRLFTFLPRVELEKLKEAQELNAAERPGLKILAEHVTLLVHGESGLASAQRVSAALYEKDKNKFANLQASELSEIFNGAKLVDLLPEPGITALELALRAKCFPSHSDALRIISAGGFYINDQKVQNINEAIVPGIHILPTNATVIRVGKKNYHIIRWLAN